MKSYEKLSDKEKKNILVQEYVNKLTSFGEIAKTYNTYANKLRRDAIKFQIPIRNKSEAQKLALKSGRHDHPTKGKVRSEETKSKIGMSVLEAWENMDEQELLRRKQIASDNWNKLSEEEKHNILHSANQAVRLSSKVGSKLETFLLSSLLNDGHKVEFHKEQILSDTKLQIDLFLPSIRTAIEIDGPSHFAPVWGQDVLQKNQKYDNKKNGLILGKGLVLIRIKQSKDFSKSRAQKIHVTLKNVLDGISKSFPAPDQRYIEIGD
jgi:very-short-patch-repair endonuclease